SAPIKKFMLQHTPDKDLALFAGYFKQEPAKSPEELSLMMVIPAFMINELRIAFQIGFMLYLPMLLIDMVVSAVLMSMGMMMLPPVMISMPFKILLFVLVDGWYLVVESIINGLQ
ncbi:MAG: flagellar biosynthetic protein FliP, partial [Candidatus Neomarinimicrobiota bacterium]